MKLKAKQHPEAELLLFENYLVSLSILSKNGKAYSKECNKISVCFNKVIWLIIMKMKNSSHGYGINRPRPRHGHKYTNNEKCLSIMVLIFIKQDLSGI